MGDILTRIFLFSVHVWREIRWGNIFLKPRIMLKVQKYDPTSSNIKSNTFGQKRGCLYDKSDIQLDLKLILCCFASPVIYELQVKAARESPAKPWSIWGDLLLSIKSDLRPTTSRTHVPLRSLWFMLRRDKQHDSDYCV